MVDLEVLLGSCCCCGVGVYELGVLYNCVDSLSVGFTA